MTNHAHLSVRCPRCNELTDSLKQYRMAHFVLFIWIAASVRSATYTACPSCMRKVILERVLINLIPANLAMFALLPIYMIQALRSLTHGHSKVIQDRINEAVNTSTTRVAA